VNIVDNGPAPEPANNPPPNQPATPPPAEPEPQSPPPANPAPSTGRYSSGDLLALHYDSAPDLDDLHSMAAGYSVVQRLGITPLVVNGACGFDRCNVYQPQSERVIAASFGSSLNYVRNRSRAISESGNRWASTLANGRRVWIADGGPMDFTADVLRWLQDNHAQLNLKRITVVQHSQWNIDHTRGSNFNFVRATANYVKIDDGNFANNRTADLNQSASGYASITAASPFAAAWAEAFRHLPLSRKGTDFSDTVELLYIIGDNSTKNVNDFANRYLR